jgi:hypothetical protein
MRRHWTLKHDLAAHDSAVASNAEWPADAEL